MSSRSDSLSTTVSYLETVLEVMGHGRVVVVDPEETRESLRERFRKVVRLLKRFRAEHGSEQGSLSPPVASLALGWVPLNIGVRVAVQANNVFTRQSQPSSAELLSRAWAEFYASSSAYTDRLDDPPTPAPFLAKARVGTLDVAIQVGIHGMTAVYAAVMDLWSRRHDFLTSDSAIKQQPRRRRALDRLFLALMRFVVGFFGSHKVDARNNP